MIYHSAELLLNIVHLKHTHTCDTHTITKQINKNKINNRNKQKQIYNQNKPHNPTTDAKCCLLLMKKRRYTQTKAWEQAHALLEWSNPDFAFFVFARTYRSLISRRACQ